MTEPALAGLEEETDPHLLVATDGEILWANRAARSLVASDCVGRSCADVIGGSRETLDAVFADFRRSTSPTPGRIPVTGVAGDLGHDVSGRRMSAGDPRLLLRVRRRQNRFGELTETLDRLNAEVARRVEVEDELRRVLDTTVIDLERSNASLREFAEAAAHDLRNPLASIAGLAELLEDEPGLQGQGRELVERIQRGATSAIDLMEGLLRDARDKSDATHEDVDLEAVLTWVRSLVDERAVQVRAEGPLPPVHAAPQAVRQLLLNLISNAAKHRGRPEPVHVSLRARLHQGWCLVELADDGPGVAPDRREAVFERGWTSVPGATSGLGLSLCRRIIEEHGGSIWLTGSDRGGCSFIMTMPPAVGADLVSEGGLEPPPPNTGTSTSS